MEINWYHAIDTVGRGMERYPTRQRTKDGETGGVGRSFHSTSRYKRHLDIADHALLSFLLHLTTPRRTLILPHHTARQHLTTLLTCRLLSETNRHSPQGPLIMPSISTALSLTTLQAKTPVTTQTQLASSSLKPPANAATKPIKSKSRSKHSYISPNEIDRLFTTLFNTNFKPPRRPRIPSPPSLRGSLLPPPCAEIDERPRWRVRRLVLWRDRVPPLRLAVLDPRKRGKLILINLRLDPALRAKGGYG